MSKQKDKGLAFMLLGSLTTLLIICIVIVSVIGTRNYLEKRNDAQTKCQELGFDGVSKIYFNGFECKSEFEWHSESVKYRSENLLEIKGN
jgi:predicted RNA methylase